MSKAFAFLYQPLMLAKFKAYSVGDNSVKPLYSYFTDRYHRVKLGPVVSEWEVSRGCPQGSAFGPLLWNIYQNDLAYDIDVNLNMHADDHQLYAMSSDMEIVNANLTHSAKVAPEWYTSNFIEGNLDKYRVLLLGSEPGNNINVVIDNEVVVSTDCLKLLGVSIDRHLHFDD